LNNGNNTFIQQVIYPTDDEPGSITVGDVNGDDKIDIVHLLLKFRDNVNSLFMLYLINLFSLYHSFLLRFGNV
jgi:hypothetical protein